MIVCIDVDGVLRPFTERCAEVFIKYHPQYTGEDIRLVNNFREIFNGYPMSLDYMLNFALNEKAEEIFLDSDPYPTSKYEFNALKNYCDDNAHQLVIITSQKSYLLKKLTIEWLHRHNFLTVNLAFISYSDKYLFKGDILIDDEYGNLMPWLRSGRPAICYSRSWNSSWEGISIKSLVDVIPMLQTLES